MVQTLDKRKKQLIEQIEKLDNEVFIQEIEKKLLQFQQETAWRAIKPLQKAVSIEEMIARQGYKPISKNAFFGKTVEIGIEEPLEELLAMLGK